MAVRSAQATARPSLSIDPRPSLWAEASTQDWTTALREPNSEPMTAFALRAAAAFGAKGTWKDVLAALYLDEVSLPWSLAVRVDGNVVARVGGPVAPQEEHLGKSLAAGLYYAVVNGRPYGFDPPVAQRIAWARACRGGDVKRLEALGRAMVASLKSKTWKPIAGRFSLNPFCSDVKAAVMCGDGLLEMQAALQRLEAEHPGAARGLQTGLRWQKGLRKGRVRRRLCQAAAALRVVREAVGRDIVAALWSCRCYDLDLARWLAHPTARAQRLAALAQQPLLLPALITLDFENRRQLSMKWQGHTSLRVCTEETVCAMAGLTGAIDTEQPWGVAMVETFRRAESIEWNAPLDGHQRALETLAGRRWMPRLRDKRIGSGVEVLSLWRTACWAERLGWSWAHAHTEPQWRLLEQWQEGLRLPSGARLAELPESEAQAWIEWFAEAMSDAAEFKWEPPSNFFHVAELCRTLRSATDRVLSSRRLVWEPCSCSEQLTTQRTDRFDPFLKAVPLRRWMVLLATFTEQGGLYKNKNESARSFRRWFRAEDPALFSWVLARQRENALVQPNDRA